MPVYIYLPPGYFDLQAQRRYATLYLLSGLGGDLEEWPHNSIQLCARIGPMITSGQIQPMIVVMPAGSFTPGSGVGSYWFNHAPTSFVCGDGKSKSDGQLWGDYVWRDLVNYVDANYRTLRQRESRAIGGLSAGGQGALNHAMNHPDLFSVVGMHSPSLRRADGSICFFGNESYYNEYDPVWLVQNRQTWRQLQIWHDDGDRDQQWGKANRDFHNLLASLGIPNEWHEFYGDHDPPYWAAYVTQYLVWYASHLQGQ